MLARSKLTARRGSALGLAAPAATRRAQAVSPSNAANKAKARPQPPQALTLRRVTGPPKRLQSNRPDGLPISENRGSVDPKSPGVTPTGRRAKGGGTFGRYMGRIPVASQEVKPILHGRSPF
jgi:hypothetical protein